MTNAGRIRTSCKDSDPACGTQISRPTTPNHTTVLSWNIGLTDELSPAGNLPIFPFAGKGFIPMQCPQCRSALELLEYEGAPVHGCDTCGGEFISAEDLGCIVRVRQEKFSAELQASLAERQPSFSVPESETTRSLSCPDCGESMRVVNYGGDSGVFVDRCERCAGIWLDQQELEKIQLLMEQWADEAPQQLRELSTELETARQAAAAQTNSAFSGSRFSFVNAVINRLLDAA